MSQVLGINSLHLQYLTPLLKWKIMDLVSLKEFSDYPLGYDAFRKMIKKIESLGVVRALADPFSRKKYVYLSQEGIKTISGSKKLLIGDDESPIHDAKASEISRKFMEFSCINKVTLEHEFFKQDKVIPDSSFFGSKGGKEFSIAFELELSRKSKARIIGKIRSYFISTDFNYVLYFFASDSLCKSYIKIIEDEFGDKSMERVMYFSCPSLVSQSYSLEETKGYFKNGEVKLGDLFR